VIPGEYGELIQPSDEIPTGSDISKEEDPDCKNGERLHLLEGLDRGLKTSEPHGREAREAYFQVKPRVSSTRRGRFRIFGPCLNLRLGCSECDTNSRVPV
jgi:hypothetical protein